MVTFTYNSELASYKSKRWYFNSSPYQCCGGEVILLPCLDALLKHNRLSLNTCS